MSRMDQLSFKLFRTIFNEHLFLLVLLVFISCLGQGCHKNSATNATTPPAKPSDTETAAKHSPADEGDLKLNYQPRKTPAPTHKVGANPQAIEEIIANLNDQIALPWDIVISF